VKVLVTGGAGYIGGHVVNSLEGDGHDVAVLDDLSTGQRQRLKPQTPLLVGSVLDTEFVAASLREHRTDCVVHVAAKKAVEESVADPLMYYRENVIGMHSVLAAMVRVGVAKLLFSSSAAVYGVPAEGLVTEDAPTVPASPYGWSKLMCEQMIRDTAQAEGLEWASLRYFNVAGAVAPELADRGENNLIPRVFRAISAGDRPQIFGTDYPTRDGTCIRDYIHVGDIADAHAAVVQRMADARLAATYNVGTGQGTSVLEVMLTTRRVTGIDFSWDERPRRAGDPSSVVADAGRIGADLGWHSRYDLDSIVESAWQAWSVAPSTPNN
jgi:UDP-glucose 4-epimerase